MEFQDLLAKAIEIKEKYASQNKELGRREWSVNEYAQALVSDASDLMKLIMVENGFRAKKNVDESLKHEVCDCLWATLVIADELGIDLEKEFPKQMDELKVRIDKTSTEK